MARACKTKAEDRLSGVRNPLPQFGNDPPLSVEENKVEVVLHNATKHLKLWFHDCERGRYLIEHQHAVVPSISQLGRRLTVRNGLAINRIGANVQLSGLSGIEDAFRVKYPIEQVHVLKVHHVEIVLNELLDCWVCVAKFHASNLVHSVATVNMIVDHTDRLHVRIGGRRANKLKSTLLECLREGD